jgi:anti-sigma factor (TIGR02949 family)
MKCRQVRKRLQAFIDGDLPARQTDRLGYHLASCSNCTGEFDRLNHINAALASEPLVESPRNLAGRIALLAEQQHLARHFSFAPIWHEGLILLAVGLLIFTIFILRFPPIHLPGIALLNIPDASGETFIAALMAAIGGYLYWESKI